MRLLLDESVPRRLRRSLPNYEVRTVVEMGWSGTRNGALLALAARELDVFVTVDKNLPFQQNLTRLPIALLVLDTRSNELAELLPLLPEITRALETLVPRTCVVTRAESDR